MFTTTTQEEIDVLIRQLLVLDAAEPDRQFEATRELGKITPIGMRSTVVDALIKQMLSPHAQALVRAHSAESLGILDDKRAVPALIIALDDKYQLTRSYAAKALGRLNDPLAIRPLIATLRKDKFFGARAEAAEALRKLCPNDKSQLCKDARASLDAFRKEEEDRKEEGSRRVLAEMNRSLELIYSDFETVRKALKEKKDLEELEALIDNGQKDAIAAQDKHIKILI